MYYSIYLYFSLVGKKQKKFNNSEESKASPEQDWPILIIILFFNRYKFGLYKLTSCSVAFLGFLLPCSEHVVEGIVTYTLSEKKVKKVWRNKWNTWWTPKNFQSEQRDMTIFYSIITYWMHFTHSSFSSSVDADIL